MDHRDSVHYRFPLFQSEYLLFANGDFKHKSFKRFYTLPTIQPQFLWEGVEGKNQTHAMNRQLGPFNLLGSRPG